ncbi:hypothetical protein FISHEDRAFT_56542 [Fistulina hepatica ATCC 64428]|uniref:F-box domain-containing protein n=1 Tax=Fistulina hepatica ATCC 64428 TaxID=1128425 RepID=A0A0D7AIP4_9AGAR|nr:hypothetical protein FISHEDRAFT_56542 [Fistulina hepatica ATCC 64428]
MVAAFSAIPSELHVSILLLADVQSILRCRQVCRTLRGLVDTTAALQYRIELYGAGMVDCNCPMDSSSKLRSLEAYQKAWETLDWTWTQSTVFSGLDDARHDLVWDLSGGVLGVTSTLTRVFKFQQLPSQRRGIEERVWSFETHFLTDVFSMDPSQDLFVAVSRDTIAHRRADTRCSICTLHVLRLSDGSPHPACADPAINYHVATAWNDGVSEVSICGPHAAALLVQTNSLRRLIVWNWQTGARVLALQGLRAYCFLDADTVIVAHRQSHLAAESRSPTASPDANNLFSDCPLVLDVVRLADAQVLARLHMPTLNGPLFKVALYCQSTFPVRHRNAVPFAPQTTDRLIVVSFMCLGVLDGTDVDEQVLCVPVSSIRCLASGVSDDFVSPLYVADQDEDYVAGVGEVECPTGFEYPWDEWAPCTSGLMIAAPSYYAQALGMKVALREGRDRFKLYDFSKHHDHVPHLEFAEHCSAVDSAVDSVLGDDVFLPSSPESAYTSDSLAFSRSSSFSSDSSASSLLSSCASISNASRSRSSSSSSLSCLPTPPSYRVYSGCMTPPRNDVQDRSDGFLLTEDGILSVKEDLLSMSDCLTFTINTL